MLLSLQPRRDGPYIWAIALLFFFKLSAPLAQIALSDDANGLFICSSMGSRYITLESSNDEPPPAQAQSAGDCVLCGLFKLYHASLTKTHELSLRLVVLAPADNPFVYPRIIASRDYKYSSPRAPPHIS